MDSSFMSPVGKEIAAISPKQRLTVDRFLTDSRPMHAFLLLHSPSSLPPLFATSLLPYFPTSLLPCFSTSLLPLFSAFLLPCFRLLSCFPSFLFTSSLLLCVPVSQLSRFPLFPAFLVPCFPSFRFFLFPAFPLL